MLAGDTDRVLNIIVVEDVATEVELTTYQLERAGLRCKPTRVETEDAFVAAIRDHTPDLILSDFSLPQFDGMSALRIAQIVSPETPFIFVSGTIGEERAIEALRHGATDYVLKTNLARLAPAVLRALQEAAERREKRRVEQQLRDIVDTSPDWIWELDAQGRFAFCSQGVREILGLSPADLLGRVFLLRVHRDDEHRLTTAWQQFAPNRRRISALAARWQHRDGNWRWLECNALAMFDANREIVGFRGTHRDITVRKEQEGHIERLNRVQSMLSSINSVVLRTRDRQELLQEAARIAVDKIGRAHV